MNNGPAWCTWRVFPVIIGLYGVALGGCSFLEATGEAVGVVGKVGWTATKAVGSAVYTGTAMASQTANQANKTVSGASRPADQRLRAKIAGTRTIIPLIKEGKSYFVRIKLNDRIWARFLVDTGASAMQISSAMARKLRISESAGQRIPVTLAGGVVVQGRMVELTSVRLGNATVENVKAIVLDGDNMALRDGLLGMTFLENFIFEIDASRQELILQSR